MTILEALFLGGIEGVTEFLPISSTGHLILAEHLLGIEITESVKTFNIAIQLGAVLGALVLYAKRLMQDKALIRFTLVAFVPTVVIGFLLHETVKSHLGNISLVAWSLILGGALLILLEWWVKRRTLRSPLTDQRAFGVGLFQTIALIPGISRAAASIAGGMLLGIPRKTIVEFSFLLAIPTMLGATVLDLSKTAPILTSEDVALLGVGFTVSFATAVASMKWLLRFIQTHTFVPFGIYRILVGTVFLLGIA